MIPPDAIFASMGMFIIDEIHYSEMFHQEPQYDIIGGGGTYGAIGARIFATKDNRTRIGWIVDQGSDFPEHIRTEIDSWCTGVIYRRDNSRLTTRGKNTYTEREKRDFEYMTPKKRIEVVDLLENPSLLKSQTYHLICSSERCLEIIGALKEGRAQYDIPDPVIIWEPVPYDCTPENFAHCCAILDRVDIFSPNAAEAAAYFDKPEPSEPADIEAVADAFLPFLKKKSLYGNGVVLRCGAMGCLVKTSVSKTTSWIPAYHNPQNLDYKVVDPTGGGNTFVGAFAASFIVGKGNWTLSGICGNIASGIAIETIGAPVLSSANGKDIWNGVSLESRISRYIERNPQLTVSAEEVLAIV
ncbi:hypothetical protein BABINDRAFT_37017 [Babjeviella inositovora NRRL Y-12698]|uniref:Carbohydrate kinase PfkB domain-containing protein n=1 Tax=Babjeviella inositovora NRRL Y-12698 TaxID=984486 RepID=A0A1E3QNU5_9ASCO|nr:uncharacterized protein BABINDRAFT_37017 [Babjeviella inositovora NRRL Y-12698]ODQ79320.1 hypothetical protein BABINDRAFT_37017 [Babjeviella inositovora NRRL Y-12698]